jgi:hypothetical protein
MADYTIIDRYAYWLPLSFAPLNFDDDPFARANNPFDEPFGRPFDVPFDEPFDEPFFNPYPTPFAMQATFESPYWW